MQVLMKASLIGDDISVPVATEIFMISNMQEDKIARWEDWYVCIHLHAHALALHVPDWL